ncbi:MAG: Cation efflux system protein CusB precursor [Syntrophus sp. PtaB.Bin001]|jgi:Cu(I)/Ag(I) efflux system membrane fusion protein|nr:MAG: Cation efflux system protein CusB precursor [Syntrophus sp. PtaB.Bin001]
MKRRNLFIGLIAVVVALGVGIAFFLFNREIGKHSEERIHRHASAALPGHEGHAVGSPPSAPAAAPEEQMSEAPTVEIPTDKQQLLGVKTVAVSYSPLRRTLRTVGRVEYDERRLATINTKIEGWIERLYVDYKGKYVRKGDPLVAIYSPELLATQKELLNALNWSRKVKTSGLDKMVVNDSSALLDAARQRLKLWDISDKQIQKIEETGTPIKTMTIFSPVNGYVVEKTAIRGGRVMPGEKLFDLADLSSVWILADVYEQDISFISVDQPAVIALDSFPGKTFTSRIDYVYPTLAGDTRTMKIRLSIPNPGEKLKPQMFAKIEIRIELGRKLVIPDDAVIDTGKRQVAYVDKGDGHFEPREIVSGIRADGMREIVAGLKEGEKVAVSAAFLIDSEAQLKGVKPLAGHQH